MPEKKQHNEIHPKLESILKEELCNRAEKLQKIEDWKNQEMNNSLTACVEREDRPSKPAEKNSRSKLPYALGGIAAAIVIGAFIIHPMMTHEYFEDTSIGCSPAGQIYRGSLVAPTIIEAIESGNNEAAVRMIDSCLQECKSKLATLDTLTISQDIQQEIEDQRLMLKQEIHELDSIKSSLQ